MDKHELRRLSNAILVLAGVFLLGSAWESTDPHGFNSREMWGSLLLIATIIKYIWDCYPPSSRDKQLEGGP